jgi:hypothetical protein
MSDVSQGDGWWLATDGKWYPPDQHPQFRLAQPPVAPPTLTPSAPLRAPVAPPVQARHWQTWHVVAIGLATLAIGFGLGAVVSSDDKTTTVEATAGTTTLSSTAGVQPTVVSTVTRTSSTVPTTTTAAASKRGTQSSPLAVGEATTLKDADDGDIDIVVNAVDGDPWTKIQKANQFNKPAPTGSHFVMVTVTATYHAGTKKQALDGLLSAVSFSAFGSSNKEHTAYEVSVIAPNELDDLADLLDGGKVSGNLVFAIEDNSPAVLMRVEESICFSNCDVAWFKIV